MYITLIIYVQKKNSDKMLGCLTLVSAATGCRKLVWFTDDGIYGEEFMIYTSGKLPPISKISL